MSNIVSRFYGMKDFGFQVLRTDDNATHEVEVGIVRDGGFAFVLTMIRNKAFNGSPVVASIETQNGTKLWKFSEENFQGIGLLAKAGDAVVIAFVGKGREGKVERVKPLSVLVKSEPVGMRKMIEFKIAAAAHLGRDYLLTDNEQVVYDRDMHDHIEAEKARKVQEEAERQAAYEARRRERQERVSRILAREPVVAYAPDGFRRQGVPALESEWPSLPGGTFVILVESIGEDGKAGTPTKAFKVGREKGKNPKQEGMVVVTAEKPSATNTTITQVPKPKRTVMIEVELGGQKDFYEVGLYGSMDEIRAARKAGLNGGSLVAVDQPGKSVEVYQVFGDKGMKTIGKCELLSA